MTRTTCPMKERTDLVQSEGVTSDLAGPAVFLLTGRLSGNFWSPRCNVRFILSSALKNKQSKIADNRLLSSCILSSEIQ